MTLLMHSGPYVLQNVHHYGSVIINDTNKNNNNDDICKHNPSYFLQGQNIGRGLCNGVCRSSVRRSFYGDVGVVFPCLFRIPLTHPPLSTLHLRPGTPDRTGIG